MGRPSLPRVLCGPCPSTARQASKVDRKVEQQKLKGEQQFAALRAELTEEQTKLRQAQQQAPSTAAQLLSRGAGMAVVLAVLLLRTARSLRPRTSNGISARDGSDLQWLPPPPPRGEVQSLQQDLGPQLTAKDKELQAQIASGAELKARLEARAAELTEVRKTIGQSLAASESKASPPPPSLHKV